MPGPMLSARGAVMNKAVRDTALIEPVSEGETNKMISVKGSNDVKKMKLSNRVSRGASLHREVKEASLRR